MKLRNEMRMRRGRVLTGMLCLIMLLCGCASDSQNENQKVSQESYEKAETEHQDKNQEEEKPDIVKMEQTETVSLRIEEEVLLVDDLMRRDYMTLATREFNALVSGTFTDVKMLEAVIEDLEAYYASDSAQYRFVHYTLRASLGELQSGSSKGCYEGIVSRAPAAESTEEPEQNGDQPQEPEKSTAAGICVEYKLYYEPKQDSITVSERETLLCTFEQQLQNWLDQQSADFLNSDNDKKKIEEELDRLASESDSASETIHVEAKLSEVRR